MTFRQHLFTLDHVGTIIETPAGTIPGTGSNPGVQASPGEDPQDILRRVLELTRESVRTLDVDERMQYALAHPDREVVDSLGAVSVVCMVYEAYSPENLIPANLLTHRNLTTLDGLTKVIAELNKRQRTQ